MKKSHVTVDGITLSRVQVEQAYAALNAPTIPKPGQIVKMNNGIRGVVVDKDLQALFEETWGAKSEFKYIAISGSAFLGHPFSGRVENITAIEE